MTSPYLCLGQQSPYYLLTETGSKKQMIPWDDWVLQPTFKGQTTISACLSATFWGKAGIPTAYPLPSVTLGSMTTPQGYPLLWRQTSSFSTSSEAVLLSYNLLLPPNQHINIMNLLSLLLTSPPPSLLNTKFAGQLWHCPLNSLYPISHHVLSNCPLKSIPSPSSLLSPSSSPSSPHTWITKSSLETDLTDFF